MKESVWLPSLGKGIDYVVNIVQKSLHNVPTGAIASKFDEPTTAPSCRSTTVREAGVCLLDIHERRMQELIR